MFQISLPLSVIHGHKRIHSPTLPESVASFLKRPVLDSAGDRMLHTMVRKNLSGRHCRFPLGHYHEVMLQLCLLTLLHDWIFFMGSKQCSMSFGSRDWKDSVSGMSFVVVVFLSDLCQS